MLVPTLMIPLAFPLQFLTCITELIGNCLSGAWSVDLQLSRILNSLHLSCDKKIKVLQSFTVWRDAEIKSHSIPPMWTSSHFNDWFVRGFLLSIFFLHQNCGAKLSYDLVLLFENKNVTWNKVWHNTRNGFRVNLLLGLTTEKIEKLGDEKHAAMLDALSSVLEIDDELVIRFYKPQTIPLLPMFVWKLLM